MHCGAAGCGVPIVGWLLLDRIMLVHALYKQGPFFEQQRLLYSCC